MSGRKRFDCVMFDLDGTVFDTFEGLSKCLRYAFYKSGLPEPTDELLRKFVGPALFVSFESFTPLKGEAAERAVKYYREMYVAGALYECRLYPGVRKLFEKLASAGVKLTVASAKPQESVNRLFEKFGLTPLFDKLVGAVPGYKSSDKKDIVLAAASGENPVMVGDRCFDVLGAHDAGFECIGVTYGFGGRQELEECGCDYIADTAEEVADIVLGQKID